MFDIGFSELVVVGVVALIVIGPERLPKVARTAGHLLGRFQRYAASVKSDISREMQLEELRQAGQGFKESIESAASGVKEQANAVDSYLKNEIAQTENSLSSLSAPEGQAALNEPGIATLENEFVSQTDFTPHPQQSLDLETRHGAVIEHATPPDSSKNS
jgi:sec-independent protein translocase protein TatB